MPKEPPERADSYILGYQFSPVWTRASSIALADLLLQIHGFEGMEIVVPGASDQ